MGWFFEVDAKGDILDEDLEDKLLYKGEVILQGKNSTRDYEGFYMDEGKPYRYNSIDDLMPETTGDPDDVRLVGQYGQTNVDAVFPYFKPVFFNGGWKLKQVTKEEA